MTSGFAVVGAGTLAYTGMACLALAMERQHRQLRPGASQSGIPRRTMWRAAGSMSLALSLWISVLSWGSGPGTVAWFGMFSAVTLLLVLAVTYKPRRVAGSAQLAAIVGLACLLATALGQR